MMEKLRPMMRDPEVKNKTLIRDTIIHLDAVSSFLSSENYKRLATLERIRKENLELVTDELENYRDSRSILETARKVMQFDKDEDDLRPHEFTAETVKKLGHSYDTNEDDSSVG